MHRVALISDVHSCFLGLDLVLRDATKRGIDEFIFCGDYVSDGPEGEEAIQRIKGLKGYIIRGNREDYMLAYHDGKASGWNDSLQCAPLLWTYNRLSKSSLDFIRTLPANLSISLRGQDILISHGSPYSAREPLRPLSNTERFRQICSDYKEKVFVFGHTHDLWRLKFEDRYFINAGAPALPVPGSYPYSHYAYAIMTVSETGVSFESVRIPCDFKTFEGYFNSHNYVRDNGMWPKMILASLKTGPDFCAAFLDPCHAVAEANGVVGYKLIPNDIWEKAVATWPYDVVA
ncbi:MAG: metallophosphoesterase family protein [Bacillota bacterium]|nr:metallophosphoesterase family protein [Bacillota bacterium]